MSAPDPHGMARPADRQAGLGPLGRRNPLTRMDGRLVAACAGTLLAGILAVGAGVLDQARRPLWLDEAVTRLEVTSPRGIFHALLSGVDFSPPVYATLAKWSVELTGAAWPAAVRAPSMLAAALTIFLFGATLRTRHSLPSALAGVLALAAHPLFLAQAFEARPYALWILGCLLTAAALRDGITARSTRLALASAFLCSVHYFGMLALGSIAVGAALHAFVVRRLTLAGTRRQLMPLAAAEMKRNGTSAPTLRQRQPLSSHHQHRPSATGSITVDDLLRIAATANARASA